MACKLSATQIEAEQSVGKTVKSSFAFSDGVIFVFTDGTFVRLVSYAYYDSQPRVCDEDLVLPHSDYFGGDETEKLVVAGIVGRDELALADAEREREENVDRERHERTEYERLRKKYGTVQQ